MDKAELIKGLYASVVNLDRAKAMRLAQEAVDGDFDVAEAIEKGMSPAMEEVGRLFQIGEMFLPELQMSADVFQAAMNIMQPKLIASNRDVKAPGRVLVGTVKGDLHAIGKDLVAIMLKTAGFEVFDAGVDVPIFTFLEQADKHQVDIIALSALLTTTMPRQREVIEALEAQGERGKYRVLVGGGPVNQHWADRIGADGYGQTANDAVALARRLCGVSLEG